MLFADGVEPVLPAVGVDVARFHARGREPIRALPAELGTEASALVLEALIERRDAHRAPTLVLFMRPRHRIVLAVGLQRARQHPLAIAVNVAEAPDID